MANLIKQNLRKKLFFLSKLPFIWLNNHRYFFSCVFSLTFKCDSACKTCNIWENGRGKKELNTQQWLQVIKKISKENIIWVTLTGGNPFLRTDLTDIYSACLEHLKPLVITIPVSATCPEKIYEDSKLICKLNRKYQNKTFLNISLDGVGATHDLMRGRQGAFQSTLKTIELLANLTKENSNYLELGFFTTISQYNIGNFQEILSFVKSNRIKHKLNFSYGIGIAESRKELFNENSSLSQNLEKEELLPIINVFRKYIKTLPTDPVKRTFLISYADFLEKNIISPKNIDCRIGNSALHITPQGKIWNCAIKGDCSGNILDAGNLSHKKQAPVSCMCYNVNYHYINTLSNFTACLSWLRIYAALKLGSLYGPGNNLSG